MIRSQDRSGWFGASDTAQIMGRWDTKTFARFWAVKQGLVRGGIHTDAMLAGTHYEGRILDALGIKRRDRQIRVRPILLRVNLDGEDARTIHEVKTHRSAAFCVSRQYWMQAQVEMYAAKKALVIDAYRVTDEEYRNFYIHIDPSRLSRHPVAYDARWIDEEYLPRLEFLAACLREGIYPYDCAGRDYGV